MSDVDEDIGAETAHVIAVPDSDEDDDAGLTALAESAAADDDEVNIAGPARIPACVVVGTDVLCSLGFVAGCWRGGGRGGRLSRRS